MIGRIKEIRNIETGDLTGYMYNSMFVPLDTNNEIYRLIQKWIEAGNIPEPAFTNEERLEYFKNKLLNKLKTITENRLQKSTIHSTTIDKDIDAGYKALTNIDGLLSILEDDTDTVEFRLADNTFVTVTKADLKAIKKEIILAGQEVYKTKWTIEEQINALTDLEKAINASIDFDNKTLVIKTAES